MASVAGRPSPAYPLRPVPATDVIFPFWRSNRSTRWLPTVVMYKAPSGPFSTPNGRSTGTSAALPPPSGMSPGFPLPARVSMRYDVSSSAAIVRAGDAAAATIKPPRQTIMQVVLTQAEIGGSFGDMAAEINSGKDCCHAAFFTEINSSSALAHGERPGFTGRLTQAARHELPRAHTSLARA